MIVTEAPVSLKIPGKVKAFHLQRLAVVYVRQSSQQQVLEHKESASLQYALRQRAIDWGWPADRVRVIDQDQGHSGATAQGRQGFQELLAQVSLDHVGVVLGIEMSRLARSCRDWHQLLELCALFGTLLADQDGLYDPRDYNDRLLLGLKGTLSEAELHSIRLRMYQGRLNKARRGEVFTHMPMGYIRGGEGAAGAPVLDPDQQVQSAVRLIFEKFEQLGSVNGLLGYLVRHDIRLGIRPHHGANRGTLEWRRPNRVTLCGLLHHPLYAGAYSWGRRPVDPRRKIPGRRATGRIVADSKDWQVLIRDHCPAYITWEQYQANLVRLAENRALVKGPLRQGPALLKGILVCGVCGARMIVSYGQQNLLRYSCIRRHCDYGEAYCQSLAGRVLDELVARQVLKVLEPAGLELSLSAAADIQRERAALHQQWRQRLERAAYQKDRAQRQYHAVEPENRLVARELEQRWEQALLEERKLQEDYAGFERRQPACLSAADQEIIRRLARDIPALWHSPKTTHQDRQSIVRHLVEQVTLRPQEHSEMVDVTIRFAGGFASQHELRRPVARYEQMHNYPLLLQTVGELRQQKLTLRQIADTLNTRGWRPPKRRLTFNAAMVRSLIFRLPCPLTPGSGTPHHSPPLVPHEWWFADLARHLNLPAPTLYSWMRRGWVEARQLPRPAGRWILWADDQELTRLQQLRAAKRTWYNRPQAADLTVPKRRKGN